MRDVRDEGACAAVTGKPEMKGNGGILHCLIYRRMAAGRRVRFLQCSVPRYAYVPCKFGGSVPAPEVRGSALQLEIAGARTIS